mmetsp:Transcript_47454/g.34739  ORF Transcript_47454/g.34739 Transcript_47454/m.34739 type:complete len:191 (+) Transcript_47454:1238-1810(+)
MIEDENNEKASAGIGVYKEFIFDYFGGWKNIAITQVFMISYMLSELAFNYMTGRWAVSNEQHSRFGYYFGLKCLFIGICAICISFRVSILQYNSWKAAKLLHEKMLKRVLNAPINLYFDVTPIGRILNRFSKDLEKIQDDLSWDASSAVGVFYLVLGTVAASIFAVPWMICIYPFVTYAFYKVFIHFLVA